MRWLVVALIAACGSSNDPRAPSQGDGEPRVATTLSIDRELAKLYDLEQQWRRTTNFASQPPSNIALGADPYRIASLGDSRLIGVLRGESALVLLDRELNELARQPTVSSPSGLAVAASGEIFVVGEASSGIARYRATGRTLEPLASIPLTMLGARDIALSPDGATAFVVEERDGRLLAVTLADHSVRELARCHGPIQVAAPAGSVIVNCLLDHSIEVRRGDAVTTIHHDGPLWSFATHRDADGTLWIAAGGVEDHPLVREDGGFGYIDSFAYLYRLRPNSTVAERLAATNLSELGVVTPKWIELVSDPTEAALTITATGYASAIAVELRWSRSKLGDANPPPQVTTHVHVPGTAAAVRSGGALVVADPLFDSWFVVRDGAPHRHAVAADHHGRTVDSRIGELVFFTSLMAPWNSATGKLSRFTCETCHFEGYGDGRVHYTGRGEVHAATRPLLGLFNAPPHFSRALDRSTTQMVHNEFRVANRHNGQQPWFSVTTGEFPWLAYVDAPMVLSPVDLRRALMRFLVDFTHRENPAVHHRNGFRDRERAGADLFRARCAGCHAARLVANDPASELPFDKWEAAIFSPSGPIVWSNADYAKTDVTPYVHDNGARVASLRRLYKKWPYFTSGSAHTLDDLVSRFGWDGERTFHDQPPATAERFTADQRAALLAFLDLL